MKNYLCSKCSVLITSGSKPSSLGCPKGSMHDWKDLGKLVQIIIYVENARPKLNQDQNLHR